MGVLFLRNMVSVDDTAAHNLQFIKVSFPTFFFFSSFHIWNACNYRQDWRLIPTGRELMCVVLVGVVWLYTTFALFIASTGFKVLNNIKPHKTYCTWWNCHSGARFHLLVLVSSSSGCILKEWNYSEKKGWNHSSHLGYPGKKISDVRFLVFNYQKQESM